MTREPQYPHFPSSYILWALGLAVWMGFATGAHVAFVMAFGYHLADSTPALIQLHGHVQLLGWAGLFVMAISLHVLPRLASTPLKPSPFLFLPLWLVVTGLGIRTVGHSVLPYLRTDTPYFSGTAWALAGAGALEALGIWTYVFFLVKMARKAFKTLRPAFSQVFPLVAIMLFSWISYGFLQGWLVFEMAWKGNIYLDHQWNQLAHHLFFFGILIPVCFTFSLRMFPLYLRLRPSTWWKPPLAGLYLILLILVFVSELFLEPPLKTYLLYGATLGRSLFILWFIFELDVLTRWRAPWTEDQQVTAKEDRRPTRKNMPDYGEFGAFEWLIYSAYFWLALGALLEAINSGLILGGGKPLVIIDVVRHLYLLGFTTQLLFGMSVRMIPGLVGKKKVAYPWLVGVTFWLINLTLIARILPRLFPGMVQDGRWGSYLFGYSGVLAMVVLSVLSINLIATIKGKKEAFHD